MKRRYILAISICLAFLAMLIIEIYNTQILTIS